VQLEFPGCFVAFPQAGCFGGGYWLRSNEITNIGNLFSYKSLIALQMNNKGRLRQLFKTYNKTKMQLSRKKFGRKNLFSKIVKKRQFRLEFFFFSKNVN
jgi:hypothetical protein